MVITLTSNPENQISGICSRCIFLGAKCSEDNIKTCLYFAEDKESNNNDNNNES